MRILFILLSLVVGTHSFSQPYVSREQAIADIDFYNKTLAEVHYNPYHFIKKEKYMAAVNDVKKQLADSISLQSFINHLYSLTALLKDSHTSPYIVQSAITTDLKKEIFFPYKIVTDKQRMYVPASTANASGLPAGAEIVSINGKKVKPLLASFQKYIGGNENFAHAMADRLMGYFLYLNGVYAPFHISYKSPGGKLEEKTIEKGMKFINALKVTMPAIQTPYTFSVIENKVGYINFMGMSESIDKCDHFLDSCFTHIKKNGIQHVAIDLRHNSGGNSRLGDLLLSYFNTANYKQMGGRQWKISQRYKDQLLANGDSANTYLQKENGSIWELGSCEPEPNVFKNDNLYTGKVYFITGAFTFSSANMLADGAKHYTNVELVGEPTGENTNDFGEVFTFALPNSHLQMQVTTSFDYGANCDKKIHQPVMPHQWIKPTLEDKIQEKDRALEYILEQAK